MKSMLKRAKAVNKTMWVLATVFVLAGIFLLLFYPQVASAAEGGAVSKAASHPLRAGLAFLAAGIAVGLGSIGAGIAVSSTGASAVGAIAEKPEIFGRALLFVALGEGIGIYGFAVAIILIFSA